MCFFKFFCQYLLLRLICGIPGKDARPRQLDRLFRIDMTLVELSPRAVEVPRDRTPGAVAAACSVKQHSPVVVRREIAPGVIALLGNAGRREVIDPSGKIELLDHFPRKRRIVQACAVVRISCRILHVRRGGNLAEEIQELGEVLLSSQWLAPANTEYWLLAAGCSSTAARSVALSSRSRRKTVYTLNAA